MSFAIRVDNLGKRYKLGATHAGSVRELVNRGWNRMLGRPNVDARKTHSIHDAADRLDGDSFWALRNVSFEVKLGEVVGIIGRNGSGKSTLLKILSQITAPTTGRVELHGRVASLLEVGTGFHPELSGRENVFLNGAILGMTKSEIRRKFNEIVGFAEIEQFIDTPVKRYSSGMYVRLAFAVAAHLEPEILVIDEVLAVGDAEFQARCLGKMGEVARGGRTVMFVSHNLHAIRALCRRLCVLDRGTLAFQGDSDAGLSYYIADTTHSTEHWKRGAEQARAGLCVSEISVKLVGKQPHHSLIVDVAICETCNYKPAFIAVDIADDMGDPIMQAVPRHSGFLKPGGRGHLVRVAIDLPPLIPGRYSVSVWIGPHNTVTYEQIDSAVAFLVEDSPATERAFPHTRDHGAVVPLSHVEYRSL